MFIVVKFVMDYMFLSKHYRPLVIVRGGSGDLTVAVLETDIVGAAYHAQTRHTILRRSCNKRISVLKNSIMSMRFDRAELKSPSRVGFDKSRLIFASDLIFFLVACKTVVISAVVISAMIESSAWRWTVVRLESHLL